MQFVKLLSVLCVLLLCTLTVFADVCPPSGFTCSGDCCGKFRLCGSTIDMLVAPGTNCMAHTMVHAADCGACQANSGAQAATVAPPASATTKPAQTATVAPPASATSRPITIVTTAPVTVKPAAPTSAPATSAPATSAPATSAPATSKPTSAPATQAPTKAPTQVPTQAATQAPSNGGCSLSQIFSQADFNALFPYANGASKRGDINQHSIFNYTYLIDAAKSFPDFGCTGDVATRKRELAAFLAQTSQETSGWWAGQPYNWGYFFSNEVGCTAASCKYCSGSTGADACAPNQGYYGRGPLQLSWNYNYYQASQAIFGDGNVLLQNPDKLFESGSTAFKTALWFWMTPQAPKPSSHAVMTNTYTPTASDISANRYNGFGFVTNIVNGGLECFPGAQAPINRIGYFSAYTSYFGVTMGDNVSCANQKSF